MIKNYQLFVKNVSEWTSVFSGTDLECQDYLKKMFGKYDEHRDEYMMIDLGVAHDSIYKIVENHIDGKGEDPKDIRDRVTSYEDACKELGEQPITDFGNATPDEIAYKKLKMIVKALNEGWIPEYEDDEQEKWNPSFIVIDSGFDFCESYREYANPSTYSSVRLCLYSEKLSDYAGMQFIELWKDFIL